MSKPLYLGPYSRLDYQNAVVYHEKLEVLYATMAEKYPIVVEVPKGPQYPNPQDVGFLIGERHSFIRVPHRDKKSFNIWAFETREGLDRFLALTPEQYERARDHRRAKGLLKYFEGRTFK